MRLILPCGLIFTDPSQAIEIIRDSIYSHLGLAEIADRQSTDGCLTIPVAAKRLGIADTTLRRWCREGQVHSRQGKPGSHGGRARLYVDIKDFVLPARRKAAPKPAEVSADIPDGMFPITQLAEEFEVRTAMIGAWCRRSHGRPALIPDSRRVMGRMTTNGKGHREWFCYHSDIKALLECNKQRRRERMDRICLDSNSNLL